MFNPKTNITLLRSITILCETDNILQNIPHIQLECEEYSLKYCQPHIMDLNNVMNMKKEKCIYINHIA